METQEEIKAAVLAEAESLLGNIGTLVEVTINSYFNLYNDGQYYCIGVMVKSGEWQDILEFNKTLYPTHEVWKMAYELLGLEKKHILDEMKEASNRIYHQVNDMFGLNDEDSNARLKSIIEIFDEQIEKLRN